MSNFAKSQLVKYGWTEGKGLGKNEDGITKAIKPMLKFDTAGFGHKDTNFENWWEIKFNNAIKNLTITPKNDEVFVSKTANNSCAISSKQKSVNPKQEVKYGNFLKAAVLTQNVSKKLQTKEIAKDSADTLLTSLTDEQLFAICGGRTMHTTARHACTLSGKLKRIAQQDNMLLSANTSNVSNGQAGEEIYFKSDEKIDIAKNKYKKDNNSNKIIPTRVFQLETTNNLKCKDSIRKQKRKINNLVHQLSICDIKENNMKIELTDRRSSRKKNKKLKRQKATLIALRNSLKDDNKISQIVFPDKTTNYKEEEIKQKQIQEYKDDAYKTHFDDEDWDKLKCNHRKRKSKRSKSENRQKCTLAVVQTDSEDTSISQYRKLKTSYSKKTQLLSISDERVGMSNKQEKVCCSIDSVEDDILSGKFLPYGKYSALAYTSETGDLDTKQLKMLNTLKKKIEKRKKKKHSKTKKLDKLSQHLSSKNHIRKLHSVDHIAEDLTSLNITKDINSEVLSVEKQSAQNHNAR